MKYPDIQIIIDKLKEINTIDPPGGIGFDMNYSHTVKKDTNHPCGSACCIGGHAALILQQNGDSDIEDALIELCKIPPEDAFEICFPDIQKFDVITADIAIRMLENYRDSGIVKYEVDGSVFLRRKQNDHG